jgi:hypothetical protein
MPVPNMTAPNRPNRATVALQVVLAILFLSNIALNLVQRREIERLNKALSHTRLSLAARRFEGGDPLESLEVIDGAGARRMLTTRDGAEHLLAVVDPECSSCAETADALRLLRPAISTAVISVGTVAATSAFAAQHQLPYPAYTLSERNFPLLRQKFESYPQVLRINGGGVVTQVCDEVRACVGAAAPRVP